MGVPEVIKLNIRYYKRLLAREKTTYMPGEPVELLEAAIKRLASAEAEISSRQT